MQEQQNQALRERLFGRYSVNLSFHRPDLKGLFVCPQCTRSFKRDGLRSGLLSEEHVPPYAVGHELITLTCRQCNNWSGAELDSDLATHFEIQDFLKGEWSSSQIIPRVKASNGEIGASIELKHGNVLIVSRNNLSNPELKRKFDRYWQSMKGKEGWKFQIQEKFKYRPSRVPVAILRAAYLIMFHYFGYEYIFSPSLEQVRQQINNPNGSELAKYAVLKPSKNIPPPDYVERGVSVVTSPPELRSFLVTLVLNRKNPQYCGVLMPGPSEEGAQVYREYKNMRNRRAVNFNLVHIPYKAEVLTNINLKGWVSRIWLEVGPLVS